MKELSGLLIIVNFQHNNPPQPPLQECNVRIKISPHDPQLPSQCLLRACLQGLLLPRLTMLPSAFLARILLPCRVHSLRPSAQRVHSRCARIECPAFRNLLSMSCYWVLTFSIQAPRHVTVVQLFSVSHWLLRMDP